MKRKKTYSSALNSSKQQTVTATCAELPDECWEFIFRLVINDDDKNRNYRRYLNPLSLVSKQFLSVTDRLRFTLTIYEPSYFRRISKRFTNLNYVELASYTVDSNEVLRKFSRFQWKQLRSLSLSDQPNIPTNGLRAFSQKITTLTSLDCSQLHSLNRSDLFLIAECFPLLEELDLSYYHPLNCSSYVDGVEALSLALIKLRKVNLSGFPINNQSLYYLFNNCKDLEEVIIFDCDEITSTGLASAIRQRPTLRSLLFSNKKVREGFSTSQFIDSLVSLKGLTCLALDYLNISDELLYSIAREGLPLTRLDLTFCTNYSYNGIFCLLSKCRGIQHLNLEHADFLNDQLLVQLSLFLGDLLSINLGYCDKITESALCALLRNCPSLSEIKMELIGSDSDDMVGNSDSLGMFGVYPQLKSLYLGHNSWLSDEIIAMFASIFPNLQLLDLSWCDNISEGICEVLRKCCKIRHLNLADCPNVKLHELNFVVPKLEVLNLSDTKVDDETLNLISKNCSGLMQLQLYHCSCVTKKGVECVLKNCRQLRERGCILT